MLALVKTEARPGLTLTDVPVPVPGINDVLIRVRKTGICGTDLHIESWDAWAAKTIVTRLSPRNRSASLRQASHVCVITPYSRPNSGYRVTMVTRYSRP